MYSQKTYPNYLSGTGYVMSVDVVPRLYRAARKTPIFHLEDVYITGKEIFCLILRIKWILPVIFKPLKCWFLTPKYTFLEKERINSL